jgi:hypothetical protein
VGLFLSVPRKYVCQSIRAVNHTRMGLIVHHKRSCEDSCLVVLRPKKKKERMLPLRAPELLVMCTLVIYTLWAGSEH